MNRGKDLGFRQPPRIPGWRTGKQLTKNKYIWNVTRPGTKGVLKASRDVVKYRDEPGFRPRRFIDEVAIIKRLTDANAQGILPLIESEDHELPWWYITPLAETLPDHLKEKTFWRVVDSVRQLAESLIQLHEKHHTFHRDIKPDNLFILNGQPVFGDFEIAQFEDQTFETSAMDKVGPASYLAPEARASGMVTDWAAADVYSLAKTLWSLAAPRHSDGSLQYPPLGHHQSMYPGYGLQYLTDRRAASLNGLMESASDLVPASRPTLGQFAAELKTWLADNEQLPDPTPVPLGPIGFAYLQRAITEWDKSVSELIVGAVQEAHRVLGTVFVDVATLEDRPYELQDPYTGDSRTKAVMSISPRYEDEDLSDHIAIVFYPDQRDMRIILGAQASRMDSTTEIFGELQVLDTERKWQLIDQDKELAESTRWPSTRTTINGILSTYAARCTELGLRAGSNWTAFRVL
ncbi:hypothetical protein [Rhodococcus sp. NPDC006774]|uniref:protein kinase domain-containing protein n=1 Tax=Rhodococcus sp. NPDC006774 TaxID=3157186 RepID=UPI0033FD7EB2